MNESPKLLDVVALTENLPERGLVRGHVGTVVGVYEPGVFEIEFCDHQGRTYALAALRAEQLMVLYHTPREAVRTEAENQAARKRFERHFGEADLGFPTGVENAQIDADLAREYTGLDQPN